MAGGGKSRTQKTEVELPESLEQGANEVLAAGMRSAALPYSPNRGVTVAAFTPKQEQALASTNLMADAFGLGTAGSALPTPTTEYMGSGQGGVRGYSIGGLYDRMVDASMSDDSLAAREDLRQSYYDAAGRIYEKANINPTYGGVFERRPTTGQRAERAAQPAQRPAEGRRLGQGY